MNPHYAAVKQTPNPLFTDVLLGGKKQGEEMCVGCYHLFKKLAGDNRYTCISLVGYIRNW